MDRQHFSNAWKLESSFSFPLSFLCFLGCPPHIHAASFLGGQAPYSAPAAPMNAEMNLSCSDDSGMSLPCLTLAMILWGAFDQHCLGDPAAIFNTHGGNDCFPNQNTPRTSRSQTCVLSQHVDCKKLSSGFQTRGSKVVYTHVCIYGYTYGVNF